MATLNEFKGLREPMQAEEGYDRLCSACHGKAGEGKSYKDYETGIPAIGNPDFARVAKTGYIGLQDHGHAVWFRNIKIQEL